MDWAQARKVVDACSAAAAVTRTGRRRSGKSEAIQDFPAIAKGEGIKYV